MSAPSPSTLAGLPGAHAPGPAPDAPRALFVHGFLGQHHQFDGWLERLSKAGFDCHSISLRGRLGAPPANVAEVALSGFVDDVRAAADELGSGTALIGHSLGALVCLKAASGLPAAPLVLLAPGPERVYIPAVGLLPALPWLMPRVLTGRAIKPPFWVVDQIALNRIPSDERRSLHESMVADSGRAYRSFLMGAGAELARISGPVLVLAGEEDRVIPPRTARGLARRLNAEFELLPGHAHWLLAEPGWESIADRVSGWLRSKLGAVPAQV